MGADLHVKGVDQQKYLDDALTFLAKHGKPPSLDVTHLRDSDEIPAYIVNELRSDVMSPMHAALVADSLELQARGGIDDTRTRISALEAANWIRHWSGNKYDTDTEYHIKGIH